MRMLWLNAKVDPDASDQNAPTDLRRAIVGRVHDADRHSVVDVRRHACQSDQMLQMALSCVPLIPYVLKTGLNPGQIVFELGAS